MNLSTLYYHVPFVLIIQNPIHLSRLQFFLSPQPWPDGLEHFFADSPRFSPSSSLYLPFSRLLTLTPQPAPRRKSRTKVLEHSHLSIIFKPILKFTITTPTHLSSTVNYCSSLLLPHFYLYPILLSYSQEN